MITLGRDSKLSSREADMLKFKKRRRKRKKRKKIQTPMEEIQEPESVLTEEGEEEPYRRNIPDDMAI